MGLAANLLTRVLEYVGPRKLPTDTGYRAGYERQVSPMPQTITRWHLSDLESAIVSADTGNMKIPGKLWTAMRRDGYLTGLLSTRFEGMIQLPLKFKSDSDELASELAKDFREVHPTTELGLLFADGFGLGAGVGEFVQIAGGKPILKRLEPEYLWYRWSEDRWYFQSIHGMLPVNPGDGRWVLFCPGGAINPWRHGMWPSLARAYIAKEHAFFLRENYSSKLANAARVAVAPQGASAAIKYSWFQKVAMWGVNTVFGVPPGYDVKLIESNGRGYEVFQDTIATANEEFVVNIAGQLVTTTGGAGFQNAAIFSTIRTDLIQSDADKAADFLATQCIPVWANERFGPDAAEKNTRAFWDVTPPKDLTAEASAMNIAAIAIAAMNDVLAPQSKRVDVEEMARRFNVPLADLEKAVANVNETPTLQAKKVAVVRAIEVERERGAAASARENARIVTKNGRELEERIDRLESALRKAAA